MYGNQQFQPPEEKIIEEVQDMVAILQELSKIIANCEELEFSTGKWSRTWFKIKFKRVKHG